MEIGKRTPWCGDVERANVFVDGNFRGEKYYKGDKLDHEKWIIECRYWKHNLNPAIIYYWGPDRISSKMWTNKLGDLDRSNDKPAAISYDITGKVIRKAWFANGCYKDRGELYNVVCADGFMKKLTYSWYSRYNELLKEEVGPYFDVDDESE